MEGGKSRASLVCFLLAGMLVMVMSKSVESFEDEKTYYPPDPPHTTPQSPPNHNDCPPPPRPPCSCTPSHGSGGSPHHHNPSPVPVIQAPPSPPLVDPGTPYVSPPYLIPSPTSPSINFPPAPPLVPIDPHIGTGTCGYWGSHPSAVWAIFGYWGTLGNLFTLPSTAAFGRSLTVQEALTNTRADAMGALIREGTASLLNSMANRAFVYSPQQVRDAFTAAAVGSNRAVARQAELFKEANEGHVKH